MSELCTLLQRKTFGGVLRVFANKPEQVAPQCDRALGLARKILSLHCEKKRVFKKVVIAVPADARRVDHDCGESYAYLRSQLERGERIELINAVDDDLFCGVLNRGISRLKTDYSLVISGAAEEFLDLNFMEQAAAGFHHGAKVIGMAIKEMAHLVHVGAVANTCAIWDSEELFAAGGFDHYAEQPFGPGANHNPYTDERLVGYAQASDGETARTYPVAGVEEIVPLVRLVRKHGQCILPVSPTSDVTWTEPTDPDELRRHQSKMANKIGRMEFMARHVQAELSFLRIGVMPPV